MSDLIKRQDAIKAIENLPNCYNGFSDTYDKACIIGTLEEVPSAQQWIPCSERLPKNKQRVIVQMNNGFITIIDFNTLGIKSHLVAWIPLPKPWGEVENEQIH